MKVFSWELSGCGPRVAVVADALTMYNVGGMEDPTVVHVEGGVGLLTPAECVRLARALEEAAGIASEELSTRATG